MNQRSPNTMPVSSCVPDEGVRDLIKGWALGYESPRRALTLLIREATSIIDELEESTGCHKPRRMQRSEAAMERARDEMCEEEFERFCLALERWRLTLGVRFVIATQVSTIAKVVREHGVETAERGIFEAIINGKPVNPTRRLRACLKAAVAQG